eukprot:6361199-Amphidinium_carterae.2
MEMEYVWCVCFSRTNILLVEKTDSNKLHRGHYCFRCPSTEPDQFVHGHVACPNALSIAPFWPKPLENMSAKHGLVAKQSLKCWNFSDQHHTRSSGAETHPRARTCRTRKMLHPRQ